MNKTRITKLITALTLAGAAANGMAQSGLNDHSDARARDGGTSLEEHRGTADTTGNPGRRGTSPGGDRLDGSADTTQLNEPRGATQQANPSVVSGNPVNPGSADESVSQTGDSSSDNANSDGGISNNDGSREAEAFGSTYGSGVQSGTDSDEDDHRSNDMGAALGGGKVEDPSEQPTGSLADR